MSNSSPKQKTPESAKVQGQIGVNRYNERIQDGYVDLERQAIADSDISRRELFARRNSADVAAAESDAYKAALMTGNPDASDIGKIGAATVESASKANRLAGKSALTMQDQQKLNVIATGAGFGTNSDRALSALTSTETSSALNSLRNQTALNQAKFNAANTLVSGVSQAYMHNKKMDQYAALNSPPPASDGMSVDMRFGGD